MVISIRSLLITSSSEEIFNSRASLDSLFRPLSKESNDLVEVMVVGAEDGSVFISIYDSFDIGCFNLATASDKLKDPKPVIHASHPLSSTHMLLTDSTTSSGRQLYVIPMDLRFISRSGGYLSLLASKSTHLQTLLRYINSVTSLMQSEWESAQDLPGRFMANIDEALQENYGCDLVTAAYHLVVTGNCYPR